MYQKSVTCEKYQRVIPVFRPLSSPATKMHVDGTCLCGGRSPPAVAEERGGESGRRAAWFKTPPAGRSKSRIRQQSSTTTSSPSSTGPLPHFLPISRYSFIPPWASLFPDSSPVSLARRRCVRDYICVSYLWTHPHPFSTGILMVCGY